MFQGVKIFLYIDPTTFGESLLFQREDSGCENVTVNSEGPIIQMNRKQEQHQPEGKHWFSFFKA